MFNKTQDSFGFILKILTMYFKIVTYIKYQFHLSNRSQNLIILEKWYSDWGSIDL